MLMEACAPMTTERWEDGYPPAFRSYLLDQWPRGKDWVPPKRVEGSSLGPRIWWTMTESRHDGGVPALLDGFVEAMDRGRQHDVLRDAGELFTATSDEVAAVIAQLRGSGNRATRHRFNVLHYFQYREIHP